MSLPKIALVTGASRGIGSAIAQYLGNTCQDIIILGTATTEEGADKVSHYLAEQKINGCGMVLDISSQEDISRIIKKIQQEYGIPNILINNAGITHDNISLRMRPEQWQTVIDTNLTGTFHLTKAFLKTVLKTRWGRIVNISSVVASIGNPGQANYVAAKAGVEGLTKTLALELAAYGITVNAIAPGFIETAMTSQLNAQQQDLILSKIPMKRMGRPKDIAHAVGFLVSDLAHYMTGQVLHVNGGMYCN